MSLVPLGYQLFSFSYVLLGTNVKKLGFSLCKCGDLKLQLCVDMSKS
jgi:hypothetical protein